MEGRQANDYEQGEEGRAGEGWSGKQWHHGPVLEYLNSHEAVLRKIPLREISELPP